MSSFTRQNLKKTVRRSSGDGRTYVYPHRLTSGPAARTREMKARLKIAVRYFETMVGRRRSEMDPEAVISLFGDHKLARGLVVAMARFYRYRRLDFAEVVPDDLAARLAGMGLGTPAALRARVFEKVNLPPSHHGYAPDAARDPLLEDVAADLSLDGAQLNELLWLDAEENWVLSRLATPEPADLLAIYDYLSLETLLRYGARVDLALDGPASHGFKEHFELLLDHYGLRGEIGIAGGARSLTVHGRADALGSWARQGWRVVRLLVRLLSLYPAAFSSGEAAVELPNAKAALRLDGDALALLGAAQQGSPVQGDLLTPALAQELRRAGLPAGWRIRADPEPLVYAGGIIAPLALCAHARRPFYLVAAASEHELRRIAAATGPLRGRAELVLLAPASLAAHAGALPVLRVEPGAQIDAARLTDLLLELAGSSRAIDEQDAAQKALVDLLNRVRREGYVPAGAVAEVLGDEPPQGELPGGRGVQSIPGFGLCSAGFLARVKEVMDDQLEYYGARIVTLRQAAENLALNIPRAEEAGLPALETLISALPEYVVVPRKLFEPYVRPLARVTAGSVSAAARAIGKAA